MDTKNTKRLGFRIALIAYISSFVILLSCIIILMFNHRDMSEYALVGFEIVELTCYVYILTSNLLFYLKSDKLLMRFDLLKKYESSLMNNIISDDTVDTTVIIGNRFVVNNTPADGFRFDPTKEIKVYKLPQPIRARYNGQLINVYESPTGNTLLTVNSIHEIADNSGTPILEMIGRNGEIWYLNLKSKEIWRIF